MIEWEVKALGFSAEQECYQQKKHYSFRQLDGRKLLHSVPRFHG
jgi:hypothetical protein